MLPAADQFTLSSQITGMVNFITILSAQSGFGRLETPTGLLRGGGGRWAGVVTRRNPAVVPRNPKVG
jgi:hypothetical protein